MTKAELDKKLEEVCNTSYADMEEIKELILAGADMNRENKFGESIFRDTFVNSLYRFYDHPSTEEEKKAGFDQVKDTIKFMLEHGWDGWEYGLDVMNSFFASFYDIHVFDVFRFFLQFDWYDDDAYQLLLIDALSEEHLQAGRGQGEGENVFYAVYEMIYAKMDGRNYESIEPYFITMRSRQKALNQAILRDMQPIWKIRCLYFHRHGREQNCAYVVTIRKDPAASFAERNVRFYEHLQKNLACGEMLLCENQCYTVVGEFYRLTYVLEGYKKHPNQIGYVEAGQPCVSLLRRMSAEEAFHWMKYCEEKERELVFAQMHLSEPVQKYPNPSHRFIESVENAKRQRK